MKQSEEENKLPKIDYFKVQGLIKELFEQDVKGKKDKDKKGLKKPIFPMDYILFKFPNVKKVLTELLTVNFRTYIDNIYVVAPKPTTLKVVLKNKQSFLIYYNERSYIVKVEGKKYYLLNIGERERAIQSIADLLNKKKFTTSKMESDNEGSESDGPSGGGGGGGGNFPGGDKEGGDEGGADNKDLPDLPDLNNIDDTEIPSDAEDNKDVPELKEHIIVRLISKKKPEELKKTLNLFEQFSQELELESFHQQLAEDKEVEEISMNDAAALIDKAGSSMFTVEFTKKDGSHRVMNCMRGVKKHLKGGELRYSPSDHGLVPVYDLLNKGYRMISKDSLVALRINGKSYKIDPSLKEVQVKLQKPIIFTPHRPNDSMGDITIPPTYVGEGGWWGSYKNNILFVSFSENALSYINNFKNILNSKHVRYTLKGGRFYIPGAYVDVKSQENINEIQIVGVPTPAQIVDFRISKINWNIKNAYKDWAKTRYYSDAGQFTNYSIGEDFLKSRSNSDLGVYYQELQNLAKKYPAKINEIQVGAPQIDVSRRGTHAWFSTPKGTFYGWIGGNESYVADTRDYSNASIEALKQFLNNKGIDYKIKPEPEHEAEYIVIPRHYLKINNLEYEPLTQKYDDVDYNDIAEVQISNIPVFNDKDAINSTREDFHGLLKDIRQALGDRIEGKIRYGTIYRDAISFSFNIDNITEDEKAKVNHILKTFLIKHRMNPKQVANFYPEDVRIGIYWPFISNSGGIIAEVQVQGIPTAQDVYNLWEKVADDGNIKALTAIAQILEPYEKYLPFVTPGDFIGFLNKFSKSELMKFYKELKALEKTQLKEVQIMPSVPLQKGAFYRFKDYGDDEWRNNYEYDGMDKKGEHIFKDMESAPLNHDGSSTNLEVSNDDILQYFKDKRIEKQKVLSNNSMGPIEEIQIQGVPNREQLINRIRDSWALGNLSLKEVMDFIHGLNIKDPFEGGIGIYPCIRTKFNDNQLYKLRNFLDKKDKSINESTSPSILDQDGAFDPQKLIPYLFKELKKITDQNKTIGKLYMPTSDKLSQNIRQYLDSEHYRYGLGGTAYNPKKVTVTKVIPALVQDFSKWAQGDLNEIQIQGHPFIIGNHYKIDGWHHATYRGTTKGPGEILFKFESDAYPNTNSFIYRGVEDIPNIKPYTPTPRQKLNEITSKQQVFIQRAQQNKADNLHPYVPKGEPRQAVQNIEYFNQLLNQSSLSPKMRDLVTKIIDNIKSKGNLATQKQIIILRKFKDGMLK